MQNSLRISLQSTRNKFKERTIGKTEKLFIILLTAMLSLLVAFFLQPRYKIALQTDYSVHFLIGMMDRINKEPLKGQYFAFNFLAVQGDPRYGWQFVKKLGCAEGEKLESKGPEGRDFYCNGEYLGTAKHFSKEGRPLKAFQYNGLIPKGYLFAVGETRDSYDSKFWGFVNNQWIIGTVQKII